MLAYVAADYRFGWSLFFFAQAPLVLAEHKFWAAAGRTGVKLHWGAPILATQCLLLLTAHLFFFPPVRHGERRRTVCCGEAGALPTQSGCVHFTLPLGLNMPPPLLSPLF